MANQHRMQAATGPPSGLAPQISSTSASTLAFHAPASSSAAEYTRPRTRQRLQKPPEPLAVPDIDEDAAERKRVLNVLAQRRYRERKRQTRKDHGCSKSSGTKHGQSSVADAVPEVGHAVDNVAGSENMGRSTLGDADAATATTDLMQARASPGLAFAPFDLGLGLGVPLSATPWDLAGHSDTTSSAAFLALPDTTDVQQQTFGPASSSPSSVSDGASLAALFSANIDPNLLFAGTAGAGGSPLASALSTSGSQASPALSSDPGPDSYYLPVPELTLLRAALRIVTRLGCDPSTAFWDLHAKSPFFSYSSSTLSGGSHHDAVDAEKRNSEIALLPQSWQPTPAQRMLAHHPLIDVLPWPAAREKLIAVLNLPLEARPAAAADPLALVQFVYDIEDSSEGMRLWGSDPFDAGSWEVGQRVFERWWFVFDRDIIEQSNRWRGARGAACLQMAQQDGTGDTSGSGGSAGDGSLWLHDLDNV